MSNCRKYGPAPFTIAVLHGGPGAPGSMAPVARELAHQWGVVEPLQTEKSLEGQVQELRSVLENRGAPPVTLIGSSWGAMLGFILTARYPALVKKLILVGSAVYEKEYASGIFETRLQRLRPPEKEELLALIKQLDESNNRSKNKLFAQIGKLIDKADHYDPITLDTEIIETQYELHRRVWSEAEELRSSGKLLERGKAIKCPVLAIHGDYDPHPSEGVREPLASVLEKFRFILLDKCGHLPWLETHARKKFFALVARELESD